MARTSAITNTSIDSARSSQTFNGIPVVDTRYGSSPTFKSDSARDDYVAQASLINAQNKFSDYERQQQQQFQTDMWNLQNEYNSPEAQRARMELAGINPNFNGLVGNGNSTSLPSGSAPSSSTASFSSNTSSDIAKQQRFLDTMKFVSEAIMSIPSLQKMQQERENLKTQNDLAKTELKYKDKKEQLEVDSQELGLRVNGSIINLNEEQIKLIQTQEEENGAKVDNLRESINNLKAQRAEILQRVKWNEKLFPKQIEALSSQINFTNASTKEKEALTELHKVDAKIKSIESEYTAAVQQSIIKLNESQSGLIITNTAKARQEIVNMVTNNELAKVDLKYKGQEYQANIKYVNGRLKLVDLQCEHQKIENDFQVAHEINSVLGETFDNVGKAADSADKVLDLFTPF